LIAQLPEVRLPEIREALNQVLGLRGDYSER